MSARHEDIDNRMEITLPKPGSHITVEVTEAGPAGFLWDFDKENDIVRVQVENIKKPGLADTVQDLTIGGFIRKRVTITALKSGCVVFTHSRPFGRNEIANELEINVL